MAVAITSFFQSSIALGLAGADGSGGLDDYDFGDGAAWFLGAEKKIKTCYLVGRSFGVQNSDIETAIQSGFKKWAKYSDIRNAVRPKEGFSSTIVFQACDGSEDLKFYFGTSDDASIDEKARLKRQIAFIERDPKDPRSNWSKGFVWISSPGSIGNGFPDWTQKNALSGVLLHEIGHIFGCAHQDGTIMSDQLSISLRNHDSAALADIDYDKELLPCPDCSIEYTARSVWVTSEYLRSAFERLIGRTPTGKVTAKYKVEPASYGVESFLPSGILTFFDQNGAYPISVQIKRLVALTSYLSNYLFKLPEPQICTASSSSTYVGKITAKSGLDLPIILNRNVNGGGALSIQLQDPDEVQSFPGLFSAFAAAD